MQKKTILALFDVNTVWYHFNLPYYPTIVQYIYIFTHDTHQKSRGSIISTICSYQQYCFCLPWYITIYLFKECIFIASNITKSYSTAGTGVIRLVLASVSWRSSLDDANLFLWVCMHDQQRLAGLSVSYFREYNSTGDIFLGPHYEYSRRERVVLVR